VFALDGNAGLFLREPWKASVLYPDMLHLKAGFYYYFSGQGSLAVSFHGNILFIYIFSVILLTIQG